MPHGPIRLAVFLVALGMLASRGRPVTAQSATTLNPVPDLTAARAVVAANPLQWEQCDGMYECATLVVPLDYSDKVPGTTTLALAMLPAADRAHRIGTLIFNPGGPGGTAIESMEGADGAVTTPAVLQRFDQIAIDPRGIGRSTPLNCRLAQNGISMDALKLLDPRDDAEWQQMLQLAHQVADTCAQNAGPILPFMGTNEFTIDLEMLRIALGEPQLTFMLYSYGTQVGALYAQRFPHSVRAMVLDSAVDLNLTGSAEVIEQARGTEQVLNEFLYQCSLTPACPFFNDGDPGDAWDALIGSVEAEAQELAQEGSPEAIEAVEIMTAIRGLGRFTKNPRNWGLVGATLAAFQAGNLEEAERLTSILLPPKPEPEPSIDDDVQDPLDRPQEDMGYVAVECLDWQWPPTEDGMRQFAFDTLAAAPRTIGDFATHLPCLYWPAAPTLRPEAPQAQGAAPILVAGNTLDEATPYEWSVATAGELASGRLLTRTGVGHIALGKSDCIDGLVDRYLIDLSPPAAGATCATNPSTATWYVPPK